MPQPCTICTHAQRADIDRAIVVGTPNLQVAKLHGVTEQAIRRHREEHLPALLVRAQEAEQAARADDLLLQVQALRNKALGILRQAEQRGKLRDALAAIREARACIELLLEVEGRLNRTPQVNILVAPQWLELRAVLIATLEPYPEARAALAGALVEMEHGNPSN